MAYAPAALMAVLLLGASSAQLTLDQRDIEDAIAIGRTRLAAERSRFHEPYRLVVNKPPIDIIHVVTPFRRVVLATEEGNGRGLRGFGQKEALAILSSTAGRIDLYIEVSFHPLNTYIGVPDYVVLLLAPGRTEPIELPIDRIPRYGPRVEGAPLPTPAGPIPPRGSEPMLGATVIARVDGTVIDPKGSYDVVMTEAGKELARARLNLERLR